MYADKYLLKPGQLIVRKIRDVEDKHPLYHIYYACNLIWKLNSSDDNLNNTFTSLCECINVRKVSIDLILQCIDYVFTFSQKHEQLSKLFVHLSYSFESSIKVQNHDLFMILQKNGIDATELRVPQSLELNSEFLKAIERNNNELANISLDRNETLEKPNVALCLKSFNIPALIFCVENRFDVNMKVIHQSHLFIIIIRNSSITFVYH